MSKVIERNPWVVNSVGYDLYVAALDIRTTLDEQWHDMRVHLKKLDSNFQKMGKEFEDYVEEVAEISKELTELAEFLMANGQLMIDKYNDMC